MTQGQRSRWGRPHSEWDGWKALGEHPSEDSQEPVKLFKEAPVAMQRMEGERPAWMRALRKKILVGTTADGTGT